AGLHISFGSDHAEPRVLDVDNVVVCAGQEPVRELEGALRRNGIEAHVIGGADQAVELDAKRAIKQGTELAARL
ncbi:NADPH-dependent 2,4-dienoyl-CoA reductase, partial [Micromonospora sp. WMMD736]